MREREREGREGGRERERERGKWGKQPRKAGTRTSLPSSLSNSDFTMIVVLES